MKTDNKKFKVTEKEAKDAPVKDIEWEGEEVGVESTTKLESDTGTGVPVVLRFFEFAANPETFRRHKPTEQELFDSHIQGIKALLWTDGLSPYEAVQPRLIFSKDKTKYTFAITCIQGVGQALLDKTQTLTEILKK